MYRDDTCAVCGESLPPDHFYCRRHGANVDARLHEAGAVLARLTEDVPEAATLLDGIAEETWDWLAERRGLDEDWPPRPQLDLHVHADDLEVSVDGEPGLVRVRLRSELAGLLAAVGTAMRATEISKLAHACREAEGADATH